MPDTCVDCAPEPVDSLSAAKAIFCENGGYVLEVAPEHVAEVGAVLEKRGAWFVEAGMTTAVPGMVIRGGVRVEVSEEDMKKAWEEGAAELML